MNTFYGEAGNQKSPMFDLVIAGGTTTLGQKYIKQVHSYIERNDCEVVYGDSVPGNEPIIVRESNGFIKIMEIQELADTMEFKPYTQFAHSDSAKEATVVQYEVWTAGRWVPIRRVIRHLTTKPLYRVHTNTSFVDVTEDHSLITSEEKKI